MEESSEDEDIETMPLEQVFSDKTSPKVLNFYKKFSKSPDIATPDSYLSEEDDRSVSSNSSGGGLPSPTPQRKRQAREQTPPRRHRKYASSPSPSPRYELKRVTREMEKLQEKLYKMEKRMRK